MVDLIVPAGTALTVDQAHPLAPQYGLFRMEANALIVTGADLVIKADRAEFEANCVIDARGPAGAGGVVGPNGFGQGERGGVGGAGNAGARGFNVMIEAALAQVGGLTVVANGGAGGQGGTGGRGGPAGQQTRSGDGGQGGAGGAGGDAGQITLAWSRAAPGLPVAPGVAPNGHAYRSIGGSSGAGGMGGAAGDTTANIFDLAGNPGAGGVAGANGKSLTPEVIWQADVTSLLWAQAQDIGPSPRAGHGMAFDPGRSKLVLFGGRAEGELLGDTWEWDGQLWTQVADTGPAPRAFHGMAFDPAGERVLVFGGASSIINAANADPGQYQSDTWGWDGESWIQLADTGPSARQAPAMAADPARQRVTLFSGGQIAQAANQAASDTWEWDGAQWTQVADTGPTGRLSARLAHDEGAAVLVLFGGIGSAPELADTWTWDGKLWRQVADTGPSPRFDHAMTSADSAVILFGGLGAGPLNDTWAWRGGAWRQIQDMGPAPRSGHAMACVTDAAGDHVTLFGGQGAAEFGDTWRLVERN